MSVGVIDFASLPHVVLEILPGHARRQIFHDQAIVGSRGSSSSGRRSTVVVSAVAITAIAVTSASASASWTPGMLDDDAVAVEVSPVEFVDRVFGVSGIFKFDKTVTLLDHDIANATVTLEEPLQVSLSQRRIS